MDNKIYDVVILGGGPAGLAAGLYAGRSRLSVLILEKGIDGGQIAVTHDIENYPRSPRWTGLDRSGAGGSHDRAVQEVRLRACQ